MLISSKSEVFELFKQAGASAPDTYDIPVVTPIDTDELESWEELTLTLTAVPVLSVADWDTLRSRLFAEILTREPNQGIAVSFDRLDYFFFYDRTGNFRARRLIEKPPWYRVSAHINLQEYFDKWAPILQQFMVEKGIQTEDLIFSTGDLHQGAISFLYINSKSKLIVLIQYDELLPEHLIGTVPFGHVLQTLWHFVDSHSFTILMRPFSTLSSLVSVVSDTALETGRSLRIDTVLKEPVPPLANKPPMNLEAWESYLDQELGRPSSLGELDFLIDGSEFFPRFVDRVTSAKNSVDIRAYIFDNDDVALEIAELLKRRSLEGVDVRVLVDGLGTITAAGEQSISLPEDHRGPVVDEINREYNRAWGQAGFWGDFSQVFSWTYRSRNDQLPGYPVRLLHTAPNRHEIFRLQKEAIKRSQSYVYIENAYFTEDSLLRGLIKARRRGVDVRVIIPLETDRGVITRNIALAASRLAYLPALRRIFWMVSSCAAASANWEEARP